MRSGSRGPSIYGSWIWLIGASLVQGDSRESMFLWANGVDNERSNLLQLAEFVSSYPELPVVTWAGDGADIPQIRGASMRHEICSELNPIVERHVDLYRWAYRNVRLPVPSLSLKEVGEYFGYPRVTKDMNGLAAALMFSRYLRRRDRKLQDRLLDYNRDDVDSLVFVVSKLQQLAGTLSIET